MESELLDLKKAAEFLGVKMSWIRSRVFKKEIPYIKICRLIRFRKEDLEEYILNNLKKESQGSP